MSLSQYLLLGVSALFIGFSKTSIGGLGIVVVPIMAAAFPAKQSTGVLLPMLIMADVFAVLFYRRHCDWKVFRKIFPITAVGVVLGYFAMDAVDGRHFEIFLAGLIFLMVFFEIFMSPIFVNVGKSRVFTWLFGLMAGFTTMTANAAGPLFGIYLLQLGLKKNQFVGTRSWFFLLLNCYKIPFSWNLGLISLGSLGLNFFCLPIILLGAFGGYYFLKSINMDIFKWIIRLAAILSAVKLLWA